MAYANIFQGWAACPDKVWQADKCSPETTWTSGPMKHSTNVSVYEQFTRTSYDRNNLSIIHVELTSERLKTQINLNETEYRKIFSKVLDAKTTNEEDISNMNALIHSITWTHRTYDTLFLDDEGILTTSLHNFIGVSLQFMVTAVQFINYTIPPSLLGDQNFAMPEKMRTMAVGGKSIQKLSIQTWTGIVFIITEGLIIIATGLVILLVARKSFDLPRSSENTEVDMIMAIDRIVGWIEPKRAPWRVFRRSTIGRNSHPRDREAPLAKKIDELKSTADLQAAPTGRLSWIWRTLKEARDAERRYSRLMVRWRGEDESIPNGN
jgi:hypothetical protein